MITPQELDTYILTHYRGIDILKPFLERAQEEFRRRREPLAPNLLGVPHFDSDTSPNHWFIEDNKIIMMNSWGGQSDHELPIEVFTERMTAAEWVAEIWAAWEAKHEQYAREKREREVAELRRLMERYPDEVHNVNVE